MKLAAWGVDSRVVVWVREFHRVGGQLSKEVKLNLVVPQTCVSCPLLFLVYVNDIWRYIDWSIRLLAEGCIIYGKHTYTNDVERLQKNLDTLGNGQ